MADLAIVYFGAQLGVEVTPGTGVAANKLLQSLGFSRLVGQDAGGMMFRPQGSKLNTIAVPPGKRFSEINFDGVMTYNEMEYILNSALNSVTPSADGTNGKKWTHTLTKSAADTKQTYSYENGNATHAQKAFWAQVTSLQLEMSREMNKITGKMMAQQIQDDISITGAPTQITPVIVAPQSFDVKFASTQAGLAGASVFGRPIKVVLSIDSIVNPLFRMNSTDGSYINQIEQAPKITLKVTTDADDAGMAFLTNMTAGSVQFIRVQSLGAVIAGAIPSQYTFQMDFCGNLIKPYNPTDEAGAALAEWEWENSYDATWTKSLEIFTINTLASL